MTLPAGRAALMGVLNVTPDSFSDGGLYVDRSFALEHARKLVEDGADLIDVGGESTRPGAAPVPLDEELRRVLPVVESLAGAGVRVSIDTMKPEVAWEAGRAGAAVINDVSGFRNPRMREVAAELGCSVCIMHMLGDPQTMQADPRYRDVVAEVAEYLHLQAEQCVSDGIRPERVWIDPGIGFGKTTAHNLQLLRGLPRLVELGYPVLVGVSRKSFIGKILGSETNPVPLPEREEGTLVTQLYAVRMGASVIRCHEVASMARSLKMLNALATD